MAIAITMGDPGGVGPEILLKSFEQGRLTGDFIVVGDYSVLEYCSRRLGYSVKCKPVESVCGCRSGRLNIFDMQRIESGFPIGEISRSNGAASIAYVETAVQWAIDKRVDAVVTLPLNKEAVSLCRPGFTGHTGFIAELCGVAQYAMMLESERLIVTHVTTHLSLRSALESITEERVYCCIQLTFCALSKLRHRCRIAAAGLNPHAGENGIFGIEEHSIIKPAIDRAREEGIDVEGPIPADTVFMKAMKGDYDAVVCMYHDQGHIPFKLLDFEGGVNTTLGLPFARTSVDHGTAFDIAYTGVASTLSFENAVKVARILS